MVQYKEKDFKYTMAPWPQEWRPRNMSGGLITNVRGPYAHLNYECAFKVDLPRFIQTFELVYRQAFSFIHDPYMGEDTNYPEMHRGKTSEVKSRDESSATQ